jgi:hypothetical protein
MARPSTTILGLGTARYSSAMAYYPPSGLLTVFGGYSPGPAYNDTWRLVFQK